MKINKVKNAEINAGKDTGNDEGAIAQSKAAFQPKNSAKSLVKFRGNNIMSLYHEVLIQTHAHPG
ncbi:MAG TPA: hypothetical protein V6C57_26490 [Coleofasciculaceae cyanobacterium]